MDRGEQIRQRLKQLAKNATSKVTILATVKSVDANEKTCVLNDSDIDLAYEDVRLSPVLDGKGSITLYPKVGTWALAVRIEDEDDWMLVACGELERYQITVDQMSFEIKGDEILLNDGEFGGLVKIGKLVEQLNIIEKSLNDLKNIFTAWTPVANDGGAKLKGDLSLWNSTTITETQKSELENESIKH